MKNNANNAKKKQKKTKKESKKHLARFIYSSQSFVHLS